MGDLAKKALAIAREMGDAFDPHAHLEALLPALLLEMWEDAEQHPTFKRRVCRDLLQRVWPRGSLSYRTLVGCLDRPQPPGAPGPRTNPP